MVKLSQCWRFHPLSEKQSDATTCKMIGSNSTWWDLSYSNMTGLIWRARGRQPQCCMKSHPHLSPRLVSIWFVSLSMPSWGSGSYRSSSIPDCLSLSCRIRNNTERERELVCEGEDELLRRVIWRHVVVFAWLRFSLSRSEEFVVWQNFIHSIRRFSLFEWMGKLNVEEGKSFHVR